METETTINTALAFYYRSTLAAGEDALAAGALAALEKRTGENADKWIHRIYSTMYG